MHSLLQKPSAWIPIVIPLGFITYLLIQITFFGIIREEDEGVGAHLFQIWLVLEPLMLGYFVFKWYPRAPKQALLILTLQIIAALLPIYVVFSLGL